MLIINLQMRCDYWANFVKTGNPNGDNLPEWKAYNTKDKEVMVFDTTQQSNH